MPRGGWMPELLIAAGGTLVAGAAVVGFGAGALSRYRRPGAGAPTG